MNKERIVYKFLGKKVKLVLPNQIFYSGKVIDEDEFSITILDKFNHEVKLSKSYIVSLEVMSNGY
jgi:hypothetical protein